MRFDLQLNGLGSSVSEYLFSFAPWFYVVGGLVVAVQVVRLGITLFQLWASGREEYEVEWGEPEEFVGPPLTVGIPFADHLDFRMRYDELREEDEE